MRTATVALLAATLLATGATAAGADTLVTAAPGARNLTANGGYQAWAAPAAGGRRRLTVRAPHGPGATPPPPPLRPPPPPPNGPPPLPPPGRRPPAALPARPGRAA